MIDESNVEQTLVSPWKSRGSSLLFYLLAFFKGFFLDISCTCEMRGLCIHSSHRICIYWGRTILWNESPYTLYYTVYISEHKSCWRRSKLVRNKIGKNCGCDCGRVRKWCRLLVAIKRDFRPLEPQAGSWLVERGGGENKGDFLEPCLSFHVEKVTDGKKKGSVLVCVRR